MLGVFEQSGEPRFPDAVLGPATESFMRAFPFAVALRQVVPGGATA